MKPLKISHFLSTFLSIIDLPSSSSSLFFAFNVIAIILYFSQSLGYVFKIPLEIQDEKFFFLSKLIFFSNFTNLLSVYHNFKLTMIFYFIAVLVINFFMFYLILLTYVKHYYRHLQIYYALTRIIPFYRGLFLIFHWILFIPCLEILMNPLFCQDYYGILDCGDVLGLGFRLVSAWTIIFMVLLSWLFIFFERNYRFQDENCINLEYTFFTFLSFLVRVTIPLTYPILGQNYDLYFYVVFALKNVMLLLEYLMSFSIKNSFLSKLFLISLFSSSLMLFLMVWFYFFGVISDFTLFYLFILLTIITVKFATNLHLFKYIRNLLFPNHNTLDFSLEETNLIYQTHQEVKRSKFFFFGLIKFHGKLCIDKKCKFSGENYLKFHEITLEEKETRVNAYIFHSLYSLVSDKTKTFDDILIFKYATFLMECGFRPMKSFMELQKVRTILAKRSFFHEVMLKFLIKKAQLRTFEVEKAKAIQRTHKEGTDMTNSTNSNLGITTFFSLSRESADLHAKTMELLQAKFHLLDHYKQGFSSYDEILKVLGDFFQKTEEFRKKLDSFTPKIDNVLLVKHYSLFSCVIFNDMQTASGFEEEFENLKKKHVKADPLEMTPLIFLNKNLVTCQASFLNKDGKILELSKNEKFARFFNYSFGEIRALTTIRDLMPKILAQHHQRFIDWSLKQTMEEAINKTNVVDTYALEKNGFIFRIRLFLGFNLHNLEDFIIQAGILKIPNNEEGVLFQTDGTIIGISEQFFGVFKRRFDNIKLSDLEILNVFSLIEGLRQNIESNKGFTTSSSAFCISNVTGRILIPGNIHEIIEFISLRSKDEHVENPSSGMATAKSLKSNRTMNSKRSDKSTTMKLNQFLNRTTINSTLRAKKDLLMRMFEENMSIESIFNNLLEKSSLTTVKFTYDINFRNVKFGKEPHEILRTAFLKMHNYREETLFNEKNDSENSLNLTTFQIKMPPVNVVELGLGFERDTFSNRFPEKPREIISDIEMVVESADGGMVSKLSKELFTQERNPEIIILNENTKNDEEKDPIDKNLIKARENSSDVNYNVEEKIDKITGKASSVTSLKSNYGIFHNVNRIQKTYPKNIFTMTMLLVSQIIFLFIFCIFLYLVTSLYVTDTYTPMRDATINQNQINTAISFATLVAIEYEYQSLNYTSLDDFHSRIFTKIINESFTLAKNNFYINRDTTQSFSFQNYIETLYSEKVDPETGVSVILLSDLTDAYLQNINDLLFVGASNAEVGSLVFFSRNFPYFVRTSKALRDEIDSQFSQSNDIVTSQLIILLVIVMVMITMIKLPEYSVFHLFQNKVCQLVNIFLRITPKEVLTELIFHKDMINFLKDSNHSFLNITFPESIFKKQTLQLDEESLLSLTSVQKKKIARKEKNLKKISLFNLRALSQFRLFVYLLFIFAVPFAFYIGTFYYWIITNNNISQLLQVNTLFTQLYTFSTTALLFNNLLLREKVTRNPDYEVWNEYYQNHTNRMNYFYSTAIDRANQLRSYTQKLPNYGLPAQSILNDQTFNQLMQGDACKALKTEGTFTYADEYDFCENAMNGAFQQGIISLLNEFLNTLKAESFANLAENDTSLVKVFLETKDHADVIIADYYMSATLFTFYTFLSRYYTNVLNSQIGSLKIVAWILCVFACLFLSIFGVYGVIHMRKVYKIASLALRIIPYEKLANDEQTIFLIKKYSKENGL